MRRMCRECGRQWGCWINPTLLCPECQGRLGPGDGDTYLDDTEEEKGVDDDEEGTIR